MWLGLIFLLNGSIWFQLFPNGFGLPFLKWFGLMACKFISGLVWLLFYIAALVRCVVWFQGKETEQEIIIKNTFFFVFFRQNTHTI